MDGWDDFALIAHHLAVIAVHFALIAVHLVVIAIHLGIGHGVCSINGVSLA